MSSGAIERISLSVSSMVVAIATAWMLTACMGLSAPAPVHDVAAGYGPNTAAVNDTLIRGLVAISVTDPSIHISDTVAHREVSIPLPDFELYLESPLATRIETATDASGRFEFTVADGPQYRLCWDEGPGWKSGCTGPAPTQIAGITPLTQISLRQQDYGDMLWGRVTLSDGVPPWFSSPRFGVTQTVQVDFLAIDGQPIHSVATNRWGEFVLPQAPEGAAEVRAGITAVTLTANGLVTGTQTYESAMLDSVRASEDPILIRFPYSVPELTLTPRQNEIEEGGVGRLIYKVTADYTNVTVVARDRSPLPDSSTGYTYRWCEFVAGPGTRDSGPPPGCLPHQGDDSGEYSWSLPITPGLYTLYGLASGGVVRAEDSLLVEVLGRLDDEHLIAYDQGYSRRGEFLVLPADLDESRARRYYEWADPLNRRRTLGDWWAVNGFDPVSGSGGIRAAYLNWNELGFGRNMNCTQQGGNVACYVSNYGDANQDPADAQQAARNRPESAVATVAMEYSPIEGKEKPIVKFYAYSGASANSLRRPQADLDGTGDDVKYVPDLCLKCHGGDYDDDQFDDIEAGFLPFDYASLITPSNCEGFEGPNCTQEEVFTWLNRLVESTQPTTNVSNMIRGWYGPGTGNPDYDWVHEAWDDDAIPEARKAYLDIIRPHCRMCHIARNNIAYVGFAGPLVFGDAHAVGKKLMPHAMIPYMNFWCRDEGTHAMEFAAFIDREGLVIDPPECK